MQNQSASFQYRHQGLGFCDRQGRTPVDEALGKPFQDKVFSTINSFSKAETIEEDEDPESQEMEDAPPEDQEFRPYNKYGT